MIPWELLDSVRVPGSGGELNLYKRDGEYSIRVDGCELMNSRRHGSEEALSGYACARIAHHPNPLILIGGLGMGFTLAATLHRLGPGGKVVLAELAPGVVKWNWGPLAQLAGHPLRDKRVTLREMDVARVLKEKHGIYHAILLDVDNGPEGLTRKTNEWLYAPAGLDAAFAALRPAGVLAIWSAGPDRAFSRRLRNAGFNVNEFQARAQGPHGGAHHTIWIAARPSLKNP
jgi:spermidine synthase